MRWITVAASAAAGALVLLGTLWIGGGAAPVTRAADTGAIVGWVYWGLPPYGRPYGVEGQAPAGQPAGRADVEPGGELPPPAVPPAGTEPGTQPGRGEAPQCVDCLPGLRFAWPVPLQGALVAVQGTSLSATTDEDGWFMIEGVPLGTYYTLAATIPGGAKVVPTALTGQPAYPVPSSRGLYALRTNVAVGSTAKPINVGALFLGRTWYGPMPAAQHDQPPQGAPSEGGG